MTELVRWDPFRSGIGMPEAARPSPFEDSVLNLIPSLMAPVFRRPAFNGPRMDVAESDSAYKLAVEVPGASRDKIDVSVYGNTLTVTYEVPAEGESEQEGWLLRERSFGKASRSISLPEELDEAGCEAKLADGVLTLTLKKKRASQTKRITVH